MSVFEAAIEDDDYCEVARHADVAYICDLVVSKVLAPTLVGLIMLWIHERKARRAESTTLKTSVTFHDRDTGRSVRVAYDGPATAFEETALAALKQLQQPAIQLKQLQQPAIQPALGQLPTHAEPHRDDTDTP